jgi:hypothetical protein
MSNQNVDLAKVSEFLAAVRAGRMPVKLGDVIVAPARIVMCSIKKNSGSSSVCIAVRGATIAPGNLVEEIYQTNIYTTRGCSAPEVVRAVYEVLVAVEAGDAQGYVNAQDRIHMHINEISQ